VYAWAIKTAAVAVGGILGPKVKTAQTPHMLSACIYGGTSGVVFNVETRTTGSVAGTNLMVSDLVCTGAGPEVDTTGFTGSIAADQWLYLDISDFTGTITGLTVNLQTTET